MRVNVYAEEMTNRVEIISKQIDGQTFTGLRFYLELPVTVPAPTDPPSTEQVSGPFMHRPGDDDSAAVTFWGKRDLRIVLRKAHELLNQHYGYGPLTAIAGSELISIERQRQVSVEGYDAAHDEEHDRCELLDAAICYAGMAGSQLLDADAGVDAREGLLECWPWERAWWKPDDSPVRNLVKAGALIAAEIDRLQALRLKTDL
jgi:hypothetical protein